MSNPDPTFLITRQIGYVERTKYRILDIASATVYFVETAQAAADWLANHAPGAIARWELN